MVSGVPVADRRVVTAERKFEVVVVVVPDDVAFDFHRVPRGLRTKRDFPEVADFS